MGCCLELYLVIILVREYSEFSLFWNSTKNQFNLECCSVQRP